MKKQRSRRNSPWSNNLKFCFSFVLDHFPSLPMAKEKALSDILRMNEFGHKPNHYAIHLELIQRYMSIISQLKNNKYISIMR